ncbi:MAG: hypothetical protein IJS07_08865 [Bacteroidales bacterium]|nr:hypothetical protein [Bacteroidales bacterium]
MLSQKHIYISAIVALLVVNIVFGILLLNNTIVNERTGVPRAELRHSQMLQASLCVSRLNGEFARLSLTGTADNGAAICFFVPPSACGACLEIQQSYLLEYASSSINRIAVFTPSEKYREMFAYFSDCKNVKIVLYNKDELLLHELYMLQAGLFFKTVDGDIEDVYIPSPTIPEMTKTFLDNY